MTRDPNLGYQSSTSTFHPTTFLRHNRQLRALLLETQPWFSARDLSKLIAWPLNERTTSKLDPDQRRTLWLESHGRTEEALMISESGVYALLVHHYHPEHRSLRHWLTNEVVAALRDEQGGEHAESESAAMAGHVVEHVALAERAVDSVAGCAAGVAGFRTGG
ncbi:hypothetical protein ALQ47_01387 [Pseudomonas cichorii]|nr:hypothetical protein ALQ47_01387 [Pseudomonas cichorii]